VGGFLAAGGPRRTALASIAAWLGDSPTVTALGIEYLTRHPDEAGEDVLRSQLSLGLPALAALGFGVSDRLRVRLDETIREDFDAGRVESLGGWLLSRTELRLCALMVAASSAADPRTSGVFPRDVLSDGASVRWTTPAASLTIPAGVRWLELPVRSGAPFPQRVSIHVRGRQLDEILVTGHEWYRLRYDLLDEVQDSARLDLRVTPSWTPAYDFRTIGIGLGWMPWLEGAEGG
jgi:hypothetical protein